MTPGHRRWHDKVLTSKACVWSGLHFTVQHRPSCYWPFPEMAGSRPPETGFRQTWVLWTLTSTALCQRGSCSPTDPCLVSFAGSWEDTHGECGFGFLLGEGSERRVQLCTSCCSAVSAPGARDIISSFVPVLRGAGAAQTGEPFVQGHHPSGPQLSGNRPYLGSPDDLVSKQANLGSDPGALQAAIVTRT